MARQQDNGLRPACFAERATGLLSGKLLSEGGRALLEYDRLAYFARLSELYSSLEIVPL